MNVHKENVFKASKIKESNDKINELLSVIHNNDIDIKHKIDKLNKLQLDSSELFNDIINNLM